MSLPSLEESDIQVLEAAIDQMTESTPPMRSFILPGGHMSVSQLHIARCVCRRAERCCVRLDAEAGRDHEWVVKYLNRLSDYLFTLARHTAHRLKVEELPWKPRK